MGSIRLRGDNKPSPVKDGFCLLVAGLFMVLFVSVGFQFYEHTVNNSALGVVIMVVSFLLAPYFFLVFFNGMFGGGWKLPLKKYLMGLLAYGGMYFFIVALIYFIEYFRI